MSLKLAEESRLKEIEKNIKRLSIKKLDFKANKVFARQNSWKGREDSLFVGFEAEEYTKNLEGGEKPKSRAMARDKINRPVFQKNNPGLVSAMGSSAFSKPDGDDDDHEE